MTKRLRETLVANPQLVTLLQHKVIYLTCRVDTVRSKPCLKRAQTWTFELGSLRWEPWQLVQTFTVMHIAARAWEILNKFLADTYCSDNGSEYYYGLSSMYTSHHRKQKVWLFKLVPVNTHGRESQYPYYWYIHTRLDAMTTSHEKLDPLPSAIAYRAFLSPLPSTSDFKSPSVFWSRVFGLSNSAYK